MSLEYLDFDIRIDTGTYPVYFVSARSLMGKAQEQISFPFNHLELKNHLLSLQNAILRAGNRRRKISSIEEQIVQDFGRHLFDALFTGEINNIYRASQQEASHLQKGLRVRLSIQPPELASLPWEFLYDPRENDYTALFSRTPVVRYLESTQPIPQLAVTHPVRILGMIANPQGVPILDMQPEKQWLEAATADLCQQGFIELVWLEGETWRDLNEAMLDGPWHIFHFIGHGGFDNIRDEGFVILSDESGQAKSLNATRLVRLLNDHHSLRLVVLNSCEGGRGSEHDILSSISAILVQRGIPAVLAMQYEITDAAAVEFSHSFYSSLSRGLPIDASVTEARKSVSLAFDDTLEWGIPILHMRSFDGRLFENEAKVRKSINRVQHGHRVGGRQGSLWKIGVAFLILVLLGIGFMGESLGKLILMQAPTSAVNIAHSLGNISSTWPTETAIEIETWIQENSTNVLMPPTEAVLIPTELFIPAITSTPVLTDMLIPPTNTPAPSSPQIGETWVNPKDGAIYVYVPEGDFMMGSTDEQINLVLGWCAQYEYLTEQGCDKSWYEDEKPRFRVYLNSFWIMKTEVTNALYMKCVMVNECDTPNNDFWDHPDWQDHPVVYVSWDQAKRYAEWSGGRLPTEAEWEKAARGVDNRLFPWGNQWDNTRLNYCDMNCKEKRVDKEFNDGYSLTSPVGQYEDGGSPYGALDMAGNVFEWTADWYGKDWYKQNSDESLLIHNPKGPLNGTARVIRGGAFSEYSGHVRSTYRRIYIPSNKQGYSVGFRVVYGENVREN